MVNYKLEFLPLKNTEVQVIIDFNINLINSYEDLQSVNYEKLISWVNHKVNSNIESYKTISFNKDNVGFLRVINNKESVEIDDLCIYKQFRNLGIGSKVINSIISNYSKPVFLYVFKKNIDALRLYNKLGFNIIEELETRYIMQLSNSN